MLHGVMQRGIMRFREVGGALHASALEFGHLPARHGAQEIDLRGEAELLGCDRRRPAVGCEHHGRHPARETREHGLRDVLRVDEREVGREAPHARERPALGEPAPHPLAPLRLADHT